MLEKSTNKIYINSGNDDVLSLVLKPNSRILDVGCGGGSLGKILTASGHLVDGITISNEEFKIASVFLNNVYLYNLELGLPENISQSQYDYVICSHVLEHIVYPDKLLRDIYDVLKPSGFLVVALPNVMHYNSRLKLMAGNFNYEDAGIWDNTHVKWYTFESAKKLLANQGFLIDVVTVTGELPLNTVFSKVFSPFIRIKIFDMLKNISKGFFGYQILIRAKKY